MSVVETNRKQLEAIGDYVTRANVNWFAVFPDKLTDLEQIAAHSGREANLIVYRTRSDDERDHHIIPFSKLSELLTVDALTHSEVNGSIRWNVTLREHVLRVSHNDRSIDVSKYFRLPLSIEMDALVKQESSLRCNDLPPPPTERIPTTVYRILRDTELSRQLKRNYDFRCQICDHSIELPDGSRYAEAHHIRPLGLPHCGPDCIQNMIVLCPNHHAMCDFGAIKLVLSELRIINGHGIDQQFVTYHNDKICTAPNTY